MKKILFWFRRDLRWEDNHGLFQALNDGQVYPVFIFDENILNKLPQNDHRVHFIFHLIQNLRQKKDLAIHYGNPVTLIPQLAQTLEVDAVYCNEDFENYAIQRDEKVGGHLKELGITFKSFLDHVVLHPKRILKKDGSGPVKVYTPYSKQFKNIIATEGIPNYPSEQLLDRVKTAPSSIQHLADFGFKTSIIPLPEYDLSANTLGLYSEHRNFLDPKFKTSKVAPFLRFGALSIRKLMTQAQAMEDEQYLNELIWREFFIMLYVFHPHCEDQCLKPEYNDWQWADPEKNDMYEKWCTGNTGFPIIDAAMRELLSTGHMHNRMRMVTASFLTKLLNIDWRLGAAHFALYLYDFELAVNIGNWQWVSGTGSDAVPYFRIYSPEMQQQKFDANGAYVNQFLDGDYWMHPPTPIIDYSASRLNYLEQAKAFRSTE